MAEPQFLTLADVADILAISASQARAMVRSGELPAIQVGGRGQWRVEKVRFEQWVEQRRECCFFGNHGWSCVAY